jgi:hypothetical protein
MSLLRRNDLESTDPVTPSNMVEQFEQLRQGMAAQKIDEENFYESNSSSANSASDIRTVVDACSTSKYFDGHFLSNETVNTDYTVEKASYLKYMVDKMSEELEYEYTVIDHYFEFSVSIDGIKTKNIPIQGSEIVAGLGTVASMAGTGAAIGAIPSLGLGAPVGAAIGGAVGLAMALPAWFRKRPDKEKGQEIDEAEIISIDVPFGFKYHDHSVTGTITQSTGDTTRVKPSIRRFGSETDRLFFRIFADMDGGITSTQFFMFSGIIQILLRRKV